MKIPRFVVTLKIEGREDEYAHYVRGKLDHYKLSEEAQAMTDNQLALVVRDMCADGYGGLIHIHQVQIVDIPQDERIREVDDLSVTFP